jgi:hypothetical protein
LLDRGEERVDVGVQDRRLAHTNICSQKRKCCERARLALRRLGVALVVRGPSGEEVAADGHVVLVPLVVLVGDVALGLGHARLLVGALKLVLVPPRAQAF